MKEEPIGRRIVPIIPDEARTFGMESLFRAVGIYSSIGQVYEPVDMDTLLYYKEAKDGQILEEGITEAGSLGSFIAGTLSIALLLAAAVGVIARVLVKKADRVRKGDVVATLHCPEAEKLRTDGHRQDPAGALDRVALGDVLVFAQNHGAHGIAFEVEREAHDSAAEPRVTKEVADKRRAAQQRPRRELPCGDSVDKLLRRQPPCFTVLEPWLCSRSSLCARMSRPGKFFSIHCRKFTSTAIMSS